MILHVGYLLLMADYTWFSICVP